MAPRRTGIRGFWGAVGVLYADLKFPGQHQAPVMTPTRELALQITDGLLNASRVRHARILTICGGVGAGGSQCTVAAPSRGSPSGHHRRVAPPTNTPIEAPTDHPSARQPDRPTLHRLNPSASHIRKAVPLLRCVRAGGSACIGVVSPSAVRVGSRSPLGGGRLDAEAQRLRFRSFAAVSACLTLSP